MPRKPAVKTPKNPTTDTAPAPWTPPTGAIVEGEASTETTPVELVSVPKSTTPAPAPIPEPPKVEAPPTQPIVRVELVSSAARPTARVEGFDEAVKAYVERDKLVKKLSGELDGGKKYFRSKASELAAQTGAETHIFASPYGSVSVAGSDARRRLDDEGLLVAMSNPRLVSLTETSESIEGPSQTWLLDYSYVQGPNGQMISVRQAIQQGFLPYEIRKETKLAKDWRTRASQLQPTPDEAAAITKLADLGTNASTVKAEG